MTDLLQDGTILLEKPYDPGSFSVSCAKCWTRRRQPPIDARA